MDEYIDCQVKSVKQWRNGASVAKISGSLLSIPCVYQ